MPFEFNTDRKPAQRAAQKRYREKHLESIKAKSRQHYADNREASSAYQKAWRKVNRPPKPKSPPIILSPTEAAYIAGFFDGEGMVGIYRDGVAGVARQGRTNLRTNTTYNLVLKISQSSKPVLEWIASKVGGWIVEVRVDSERKHYAICRKGDKAKNILQALAPYLIVKKEQAEKAIEFQERQSAEKSRYETGRTGPVPRTVGENAYKEHYYRLLRELKRP